MSDEQRGHRRRWLALASAALLVAAGVAALIVGLRAQQEPPLPSAATRPQAAAPSTVEPSPPAGPTTRPASPPAAAGPTLPASRPTRLEIPAIGVASSLVELGLAPDGSVQVPRLDAASRAGWYRGSPTPGELGPAVILGHVDSAEFGPAVFFRLGDLRPGDAISVSRADGAVATFRVDRVETHPKASFPTVEVYGNTHRSELRLITCGGDFDAAARSYKDNIVVFASLTERGENS